MNVLLLGSGGREHAIAFKIAESKHIDNLYIAHGNAGTLLLGKNIDIDISDFSCIDAFVKNNSINMLVVGPETPLCNGIKDFIQVLNPNLMIIGPNKKGATLEGSKDFSKRFMQKYGIATAKYQSFNKSTIPQANAYLRQLQAPYVIKADGLAAGKGVIIAKTIEEAEEAIKEMLEKNIFGIAGNTIIIEEYLQGVELSVFILYDGKNYVLLPEAKDYKRVGEHDTGLNTGGMGSVSPVPFADKTFMDKVENNIIIPTLHGLQEEQIDYSGFIFFGLMNCEGNPYLIEYNCRMGDPETEVVFPRINNDIIELFSATANQKLNEIQLNIKQETAACVMLVSKGYPESYPKGMNIEINNNTTYGYVFHAGTKLNHQDKIIASGGRVIAVSAFGSSVKNAFDNAYKMTENINFDNKHYRLDLGKDLY